MNAIKKEIFFTGVRVFARIFFVTAPSRIALFSLTAFGFVTTPPTSGAAVEADHTVSEGDVIQNAIAAAGEGDVIAVGPGIYEQEVVVDVNGIQLVATGGDPAVLYGDEGELETGIRVVADDVTIDGFTVLEYGSEGLGLEDSSNATVRNNLVHDNDNGISGTRALNTTVKNNTVTGSSSQGIGFWFDSDGTVIEDNEVTDTIGTGVYVNAGDDVVVRDNFISNAGSTDPDNFIRPTALQLDGCPGAVVTGNAILYSEFGLFVAGGSSDIHVENNGIAGHLNTAITHTAEGGVYRMNHAAESEILFWVGDTVVDVEDLVIGDSTRPGTTVSFEGHNVSLSAADSEQAENPDAAGIGRFFKAEDVDSGGYLDVRVHYGVRDLHGIDESELALWRRDNSDWEWLDDSVVDVDENTVNAYLTEFSTYGVFGPAPLSFAEWMANLQESLRPPENLQGFGDVPAGDGVANLLKYALGLYPLDPATGALPKPELLEQDGEGYLTLTFEKNPLAEGIEYVVEVSSDFENWKSGEGETEILEENGSTITVRDKSPVGDEPSRFMRLVVNPVAD